MEGVRSRRARAPGERARQSYCLSRQALQGSQAKIRHMASPADKTFKLLSNKGLMPFKGMSVISYLGMKVGQILSHF